MADDVLSRLEAAIREDRLLAFVSDLEGQIHEARAALQEIAEYKTDYSVGPDENVGRLQAIAERVLG